MAVSSGLLTLTSVGPCRHGGAETMTCSTLELTGGDEPIMCSYGDGTWLTGFATGLTQPAGVDAVFLECHYDSGGPPLGAWRYLSPRQTLG